MRETVAVTVDVNGISSVSLNHKTLEDGLLSADALPVAINALWDAAGDDAALEVLENALPKDSTRQVALYCLFALNNLTLKSARNQIAFAS